MTLIREKIDKLINEVKELKQTLIEKEEEIFRLQNEVKAEKMKPSDHILSNKDIVRYSRQMIIPQIGVQGQKRLKDLSVLVVGVGGLGCPAATYLAGAGVGRIGLVDYDVVEENNLHRQLLHNEHLVGKPKVESAAIALKKLNSEIQVDQHQAQLSSSNALDMIKEYDVVVDASDNVATRYLVSDACVLADRPLVSGSALQMEGQLTVYNHAGGPCYRCLYPQPPPPHTVTNCSDAGVLGAVPGVIGTLQALEVVKIALKMPGVLSSRLLLFDGEDCVFRNIKLRQKREDCAVCGKNPSIHQLVDYEQFCGAKANDKEWSLSILSDEERILPQELHNVMQSKPYIVVDVRQPLEYEMCHIPNSVNIPLPTITRNVTLIKALTEPAGDSVLVCMVCRRGNDSQLAVRDLKAVLDTSSIILKDLKGGLHAWSTDVDPNFPIY
ncbi:adenylyltransferase and sulfurtransferase MOCS3 [Macrosteles quadrilineatus]|uniref:adenylyltransferase and sulfurtransferase MOCS3 n=1 Tax=Macrosteles quadrilineatus TaxID=74068 RepID=UPI0023E212B8|nr:adenylyltransferase and sulfurtransferase MOCS3 [Macrosteles quadrilineatus]